MSNLLGLRRGNFVGWAEKIFLLILLSLEKLNNLPICLALMFYMGHNDTKFLQRFFPVKKLPHIIEMNLSEPSGK